jgi:hypothetical protein
MSLTLCGVPAILYRNLGYLMRTYRETESVENFHKQERSNLNQDHFRAPMPQWASFDSVY